jgi:hypothetical protein
VTYGIGAGGIMGVALEATPGTYVAPTKFFPFLTESLEFKEANNYRRPIRQSAAQIGVIPGDFDIEGTITLEATEDACLYFTECARAVGVKTGTTPNWIYTYTPTSAAVPAKTMSVTVVRNGVVFGYTGVSVTKTTFTVNNNVLEMDCDVIGLAEASQSAPTATWPTSVPYGPGSWAVQIPTSTAVTDMDTFSFECDDAGASQYRLKNARGAAFVQYGERTLQMTASRDFLDSTDYTAFKAVTGQSTTISVAPVGSTFAAANNAISFTMNNAIKDVYQVNLSGQGDLVRASITYQSTLDSAGAEYSIVYKTQETITPHT